MPQSFKQLLKRLESGDPRAVARLISLTEDNPKYRGETVKALFKKSGRARIIGVTGAPGAGKSTLVDQLAMACAKEGAKPAILAVDPSSPFSGGAILGDRIRMSAIADYPKIFVRSMASRGALGGLSHAVLPALYILEAAGFDTILVETVGVGQAEVDIARFAETCLVVLVPGMGDGVQSIKAGILEIADIFVINKSEREGANILEKEVLTLIGLVDYAPEEWRPKVVRTVAVKNEGTEKLIQEINKHQGWLKSGTQARSARQKGMERTLLELASDMTRIGIENASLKRYAKRCLNREIDPYSAAYALAKSVISRR